ERVYGVDPSGELRRMAAPRAAAARPEVTFLTQSAEQALPLEPGSIDTVVVTWSLCSIPDPVRALELARQTLAPGGSLIFIEHGRTPDPAVARWQDRLTPAWKHIGGGCHLNRQIDVLLMRAGFEIHDLRTGYLPGPKPMTFTYQGSARPR